MFLILISLHILHMVTVEKLLRYLDIIIDKITVHKNKDHAESTDAPGHQNDRCSGASATLKSRH